MPRDQVRLLSDAHAGIRAVIVAVAAGGVLGALARYGLTAAFPTRPGGFDWAVFGINVSGCFAIGVVTSLLGGSPRANPLLRPFLVTGVLGGFTTFSTYAVTVQRDISHGAARIALLYAAVTVVAALPAAWAGAAASAPLRRNRDQDQDQYQDQHQIQVQGELQGAGE